MCICRTDNYRATVLGIEGRQQMNDLLNELDNREEDFDEDDNDDHEQGMSPEVALQRSGTIRNDSPPTDNSEDEAPPPAKNTENNLKEVW